MKRPSRHALVLLARVTGALVIGGFVGTVVTFWVFEGTGDE